MDLTVNNNKQSFNALRIKLPGSKNELLDRFMNGYKHVNVTNSNNEQFTNLFFYTDEAEALVAKKLRKNGISYTRCAEVDNASVPFKYFWANEGRMPSKVEEKNITEVLKQKGIVIPTNTRLPNRLSRQNPSDKMFMYIG